MTEQKRTTAMRGRMQRSRALRETADTLDLDSRESIPVTELINFLHARADAIEGNLIQPREQTYVDRKLAGDVAPLKYPLWLKSCQKCGEQVALWPGDPAVQCAGCGTRYSITGLYLGARRLTPKTSS